MYSSCLQVCDCDMLILNINARNPGSSQDSFIWAYSAIRAKMGEIYREGKQGWLLGLYLIIISSGAAYSVLHNDNQHVPCSISRLNKLVLPA